MVDSSAWLEYFADGPNAAFFGPAIENDHRLVVPSICVAEVFRDAVLTREAGRVGIEFRLPLADSIVYATARACSGTVWTQDSDFESLPRVRYRAKVR